MSEEETAAIQHRKALERVCKYPVEELHTRSVVLCKNEGSAIENEDSSIENDDFSIENEGSAIENEDSSNDASTNKRVLLLKQ